MSREPRDQGRSIQAKLKNLANARKEEVHVVLIRYVLECVLFRLARSDHASEFLLKGAMLLCAWRDVPRRPTRDLDLLCGAPRSPLHLREVFRAICSTGQHIDGVSFDPDSVRVESAVGRRDAAVDRVVFGARLGTAVIGVQVDVGYGDIVVPAPDRIRLHSMLRNEAAELLAYPPQVVVAEKFQAMVELGRLNSRMKDYYDLLVLSDYLAFDGERLVGAVDATFRRRETQWVGGLEESLDAAYGHGPKRAAAWSAFLRRTRLELAPADYSDVARRLDRFLGPPAKAVHRSEPFPCSWEPGVGWAPRNQG
ncbi:MAG: nucleotidyl transferase AbiEii/AbiGii toxin family protein [Planctomycetota bacterium]